MKQRRLTTTSLRKRRAFWLALLLTAACLLPASDSGPSVGARFPAFDLPGKDGQHHTLKSILGPKGAMVLVLQSAEACSQCAELERNHGAFQKLGLGFVAVSRDSVSTIKEVAARENLHFAWLSDSKIAVTGSGWFVLDVRGMVAAKFTADYTSAAILVHQFGWTPDEPAKEVEGKQLTAKIGASNAAVAPGQRVALTLDIDLQPNMHVYAPGVEGYIPIDWKMQNSETASVSAAVFPRSQKLYLKAIGETVPAYRGHFRLTRDITIPQEDKLRPALDSSAQFTVPGSLRYQACDDRVCYIPRELHLTWTFQYKTLDQPPAR